MPDNRSIRHHHHETKLLRLTMRLCLSLPSCIYACRYHNACLAIAIIMHFCQSSRRGGGVMKRIQMRVSCVIAIRHLFMFGGVGESLLDNPSPGLRTVTILDLGKPSFIPPSIPFSPPCCFINGTSRRNSAISALASSNAGESPPSRARALPAP